MEYAGICDIGKKRSINQDAILMEANDNIGLFVVADGMGGHSNGELASQCIVTELTKWWIDFSEEKYENDFARMMYSIQQRVEEINNIIYKKYNQNAVCGSTVVILFIYKTQFGIIYIGDSRVYQYKCRKFKQLSRDDVWENQVGLSIQEKRLKWKTHQGKLINAVGTNRNISYHVITNEYEAGMLFLLCSDGLYKFCDDKQLKYWMKKGKKVKDIKLLCEELRNIVYKNGADDNVSIIFIR